MRRAAPAAISPKLLRHFAAATIALTTCLAIFAESSAPEEVVKRVEKTETQKQVQVNLTKSNRQMRNGLVIRGGTMPVPVDTSPGPEDDGGDYHPAPLVNSLPVGNPAISGGADSPMDPAAYRQNDALSAERQRNMPKLRRFESSPNAGRRPDYRS